MGWADVPMESRLQPELAGAYFYDSFRSSSALPANTALEIALDYARRTPAWFDFMMTARNRIVAPFGLKDLGKFSDIDAGKKLENYRVGDRVGIFSIFSITDQEVVFCDADKHLRVLLSVFKHPDAQTAFSVTTVVHVHNLLGRAYLLFVVPVHKLTALLLLKPVTKT